MTDPAVERLATDPDGEDPKEPARPYWWMWPARHMELIRPGLRAATDADSRRLRVLPSILGAVLLPAAAILIPLLASAAQATTPPFAQGDPYDPWTLLLYDVFTESVPFMLAGFAIGMLAPAAGLLFVLAYGLGNIAATVITGELEPPLPALYGRFASLVVLWLLVGEIPLLGRAIVERWRGTGAPFGRRARSVFAGWLVASAMAVAWSLSAGLLIGVVFLLTSPFGAGPTLRATNTLEVSAYLFFLPAVVLAFFLLAIRYRGRSAPLAIDEPARPEPSLLRRRFQLAIGLALTVVALSGTLHKEIDLVVLVGGLALARPAARWTLRATKLARTLARIPWHVRVAGAAALGLAFSFAFLTAFNNVDISRWFYAIVAIVVSFFIIEIALEADSVERASTPRDVGAAEDGSPAVASVVTMLVVSLLALTAMAPAVTFADAFGDLIDTAVWVAANSTLCAAALAAMLLGAMLGSGDKPTPPPQKKPPPINNPYARRPSGPPPVPFGKPPPKAPPPDDDFKFFDFGSWF